MLAAFAIQCYNCLVKGAEHVPINSFADYPMTWKPEISRTSKSLYQSLAHQLEQDIISGKLLPGTKLPPQRELADFLDINVSTVSKAFKACELKGLLSATIGSGTYVSYGALSNLRLLTEQTPKHIIEMGAVVPDYGANKLLLPHLQEMVNEPGAERLLEYSRPGNTLWQKDAAVVFMKKCGLDTERDNILFSNGGQNAIVAVLAGLLNHGDKIGTPPHSYSDIKSAAVRLGVQLVPIKLTDEEIDVEALIYACKNYSLKAVYIISDHQNPTTHTMSESARKELAEVARTQDIFIIEDGTYHFMSERLRPIASYAPERTIYIANLSKAITPGLRLAFISVPPQYRSSVSNALYTMNVCVSRLMAELSSRMIVSGQIDTILDAHREKTVLRNQLINKYLSDYDCRGDLSCIFRWLYLPGDVSGAEFEALALEHGVQVYSAERFAVGSSAPEKAVRLAVCGPESPEELERGLKILRRLLDNL